jgi:hypothetical protein
LATTASFRIISFHYSPMLSFLFFFFLGGTARSGLGLLLWGSVILHL